MAGKMATDSIMEALKDCLRVLLAKEGIKPLTPNLFSLSTSKTIGYRCAIAFQLSAREGGSAQSWAKWLSQQTYTNFNLIMQPDGNVDFLPTSIFLGRWLTEFGEHWQQISLNQTKVINYQSYQRFNPFFCQYAYARCCSLQQLVREEGGRLNHEQIPWLFFLENPTLSEKEDWELLQGLIFICDRFKMASDKEILKLTMALSESLLLFERYCQILGDLKRKKPELFQVRLALVADTAIILKSLVSDRLELEVLEG